MAGEEKTEQATPKRRKDARQKGQVVKSMELTATFGLLTGVLALKAFGQPMVQQWELFSTPFLSNLHQFVLTEASLSQLLMKVMLLFGLLTLPFLAIIMIASVTASVLQSGLIFSSKAFSVDLSRLNPLQGLTRMFSQRSAVEMLKSCLKAALIGYAIYSFFNGRQDDIIGMTQLDPRGIGLMIANLCFELMLRTIAIMGVISIADYIYQRWQFEKSIRMTKQEIKEEYKQTEGDPMIKSRVRQLQRAMARRRMMSDVKTATAIVTNPTHFAVALRYEPGETPAPRVVAKGQRLIAAKIKEIAAVNGIPIIENKPLARALYSQCEVGEFIPGEFYQAVAEIIAFVFRQSGRTAHT